MVEVLIGVVLLAFGGVGGWMLRGLHEMMKRANVTEPGLRETEAMREEQRAFEALLGYNAETAYGLDGKVG